MAVFLRKMLGIGSLPDDMQAQAEAEGLIHLAEFVPVTFRFSGHVPGKTAKGNIRSYVGALVLTNQRVLGTLSSVPKKAGRAVDVPDISVVEPTFSGSLSLHYKTSLPQEVLMRVPQRSFAFDVPPKFVYSTCGVPRT
jgi:hypothetical protein